MSTKLKKLNCKIDLFDPWANNNEIKAYNIFSNSKLNKNTYDGIIITSHKNLKK